MGKRCGCAGGGGGVLIVNGDLTEVEGTGSAQDPYAINVVLSIAGRLADGSNTTVSGEGTSVDPYRVDVDPGTDYTVAPASGETVVIPATAAFVYLDHAATIAALTLEFPNTPTALFKEIVVRSRSIVTALTLSDQAGVPANTFDGGPTTLAATSYFRMRLVGTVWRRVG
jgi:hypothetical protein